MKANIDVGSRSEGAAIRAGLEDPELRALCVVLGVFKTLPNDRARQRVMRWVEDHLSQGELPLTASNGGGEEAAT
jgi:hypothetical protein